MLLVINELSVLIWTGGSISGCFLKLHYIKLLCNVVPNCNKGMAPPVRNKTHNPIITKSIVKSLNLDVN